MAAGSGDLNLALRITADVKQATDALKQTSAQIDQVGASAKAASGSSNSYTQQMSALTQANVQAAKSSQDAAAALALMAKIDPAAGKLDQLDALEAELGRLHKAGAIGADDFEHLGGILTAQRSKLADVAVGAEKAASGMGHLSLNSAFVRREFGRVGTDVVTGNFGRLEQTSLTLANAAGLLGPLFTATGAAILGVVAVIGGYVAAVAAGEAQQHQLETALIATGDVAGVTAGQLGAMRDRIGQATGSFDNAQKALIVLAQSGKVGGEALESLGRSAVNLSQLTGQSVDQVAAQIAKIGDAPSKTIVELNDKYHFLTLATYEQVRALEDQGRTEDAVRVATQALTSATDGAVAEMEAKAGTLQRVWAGVAGAIAEAKQHLLDLGRTDVDYRLKEAKDRLADLQSGLSGGVARGLITPQEQVAQNAEAIAAAKAQVAQIQAEKDKADAAAAADGEYKKQGASIEHATQAARDLAAQERKRLALLGKTTEVQKVQVEIDQGDLKLANPEAQRAALTAAAALDAEQAELDAQRKKSHAGGLGIDRAQLANDVSAYQTAWQAAQHAFSDAEKKLDAARRADTISDAAYFDAKKKDIADLLAAQLKALDAERAGLLAHATTAAQRTRVSQQVADIDAKIEQAKQDAAAKTDELQQAIAENEKKRAEEYSQLQQQYYEAIGDTATAQMLRAQQAFAKTTQEMQAAGNADGVKMAQALFNVEAAKTQLGKIEQAAENAFSQIDLVSQRASADQQAGLITELQARQQVINANLQYAKSLQADLAAAQQLAAKTNNPADILHVAQLTEKIRELRLVTSAVGEQIQSSLTDGFSSFLQNVITGAKSLREAFRDLLASIGQSLAKIASDNIAQTLFGHLQHLFQPGSVGGAAASAAGNAANATAMTTAATAAAPILGGGITAGGATAATAMATAITTAGATAAGDMAAAIAGAGAGGNGLSGLSGLLGLFGGSAGISSGVDGSLASAASVAFTAATGGAVSGPGTETSDSILARLSTGEFVTHAAAVRHYGLDMMHAINQRRFPRFAEGGFVSRNPPRLASGSVAGHQARPQTLKVVPVFDASQIAGATAGRAGEQVFVMHFRNNIASLRAMLGAR